MNVCFKWTYPVIYGELTLALWTIFLGDGGSHPNTLTSRWQCYFPLINHISLTSWKSLWGISLEKVFCTICCSLSLAYPLTVMGSKLFSGHSWSLPFNFHYRVRDGRWLQSGWDTAPHIAGRNQRPVWDGSRFFGA